MLDWEQEIYLHYIRKRMERGVCYDCAYCVTVACSTITPLKYDIKCPECPCTIRAKKSGILSTIRTASDADQFFATIISFAVSTWYVKKHYMGDEPLNLIYIFIIAAMTFTGGYILGKITFIIRPLRWLAIIALLYAAVMLWSAIFS